VVDKEISVKFFNMYLVAIKKAVSVN